MKTRPLLIFAFVLSFAIACGPRISKRSPSSGEEGTNNASVTNNATNTISVNNTSTNNATTNNTSTNNTSTNNTSTNNTSTNNTSTNNTTTNNTTTNNTSTNNTTTNNTSTNNTTTNNTTTNNQLPVDACENNSDLTILSDPAVREPIEDCGFECFGDNDISSCAANCVERDTGLTTGCSICFGELTECTITHCFNECAQGTDTTACRECQDMFCTVDFETCSGITAP